MRACGCSARAAPDSGTWLGASLEGTVLAAPMFIGILALFRCICC